MANKQTMATKKYQDKTGIISKSYKLRKELVEEFARACELADVSQAAVLSKMMKEFIEKTKDNTQGTF